MPLDLAERWFASRRWTPFQFQRDCWRAYLAGESGLLHAPTGTGKTLAVWLGPILESIRKDDLAAHGARVIWLTPLRALAGDTADALAEAASDLGSHWTIDVRTGDTPSRRKSLQRDRPPSALVTTPESLSILMSYEDWPARLRSVRCVVVDEWHELLGTKRGVQTELALARLRAVCPELRTWGVSATLGNIEEAAAALVGTNHSARIVRGAAPKRVEVETLLPASLDRFPWSGHIGTALAERALDAIDRAGTTLLFTNTRSQAEIWFRTLLGMRPDLLGRIALHHGSLDQDIRAEIERLLRAGRGRESSLRCVVCTSSLDLGVDFGPVDQVIQVGSPKGVARFVQRAGRSGHRPGAPSRIVCIPSNALELIEFAAARDAIEAGELESRPPLRKPLDVLAQHLVTAGMGGGFDASELLQEVRTTYAFADLTDEEWGWTLDFVGRGGPALTAYPEYARVGPGEDGRWRVRDRRIATLHRMGIGTIVADSAVRVQYATGRTLGSIEESFIARLRPGDRFVFAGQVLELVRLREMTAQVRRASRRSGAVPRWNGGRMPLSTQLARAVRARLSAPDAGALDPPEMIAVRPLLNLQRAMSVLPAPDELLIETLRTQDGHHAFLFPFAGRLAHEGLGAVLALRVSRLRPATVQAVANDYGVELFSAEPLAFDEPRWRTLLTTDRLLEDLMEALNATELARRQFREVARVAGLTHQGYPGRAKPSRQLQASSDMFFDVFSEFDPNCLLLTQAVREVLDAQLEVRRLRDTLESAAASKFTLREPADLTPLSFPLWAEQLRATTASSQTWEQRVRSMVVRLEARADAPLNVRKPAPARSARHAARA